MRPVDLQTEAEDGQEDFKALSAEEAARWRQRHALLSPWRVVAWQAAATVLVALAGWAFGEGGRLAWSAGYGGLAALLPSALLARGMQRRRASAGAAMVALMVWELVKIALTVAMLAAAPRLVPGLSWLALVVGMVVVMKTYWIALLARPGVRKTV